MNIRNPESIFQFAASLARTQAATVTTHEPDALEAIRQLCSTGAYGAGGTFYTIKKENGRYLAAMDFDGGHGFYGAPEFQLALAWLIKRVDPTVKLLCAVNSCPFCTERENGCDHAVAVTALPGMERVSVFTCVEWTRCDVCDEYTDTDMDRRECLHCGRDHSAHCPDREVD